MVQAGLQGVDWVGILTPWGALEKRVLMVPSGACRERTGVRMPHGTW